MGSEIIIDSREPWEQIFQHMEDLQAEPEYRLEALDHGADFVVRNGSELAIQRKTVGDFVSSIGDLKETLYDARTNYQRAALLIEGDWSLVGGTIAQRRGSTVHQTIPAKSLHNFVLSQQLRGTMFLTTGGLKETCRVLLYAHDYMDEPMSGEGSAETPVVLLTSMPGIGPTAAGKLVSHFGSVGNALSNVSRWDDVKGIGPSTIEDIEEWLQE